MITFLMLVTQLWMTSRQHWYRAHYSAEALREAKKLIQERS